MLLGSGAVAHKALSPAVEYVTPWVAIAGRHEMTNFHCPQVDDMRARHIVRSMGTPRRFDRRAHRDAFQVV